MTIFAISPQRINSKQVIYQLLFMLPAIVFFTQAIFQIGNTYSIPLLKFYQTAWIICLSFSLLISLKILRSDKSVHIKAISACLALISLYFIVINLKTPFYLLRDLFEFLADFFGFIGDLISGKVH